MYNKFMVLFLRQKYSFSALIVCLVCAGCSLKTNIPIFLPDHPASVHGTKIIYHDSQSKIVFKTRDIKKQEPFYQYAYQVLQKNMPHVIRPVGQGQPVIIQIIQANLWTRSNKLKTDKA